MRFREFWKKLGATSIGILITEVVNHFCDYWMFPAVVLALGVKIGWPVLLVLALVINYLHIWVYKKTGVGEIFQWVEEVRSGKGDGKLHRLIRRILNWGRIPTILVLAFEDPAKSFVYARSHVLIRGFSAKDWFWYVAANVFSVSIWVWTSKGGIELVKWVWQVISG